MGKITISKFGCLYLSIYSQEIPILIENLFKMLLKFIN
jgi:hypothetical protein